MFIVLIRTAILYITVILAMRLMGKRQLGELQPYEFVITMMIADLAALPMQDTRLPLFLGIIPIITLLFLKIVISYIQLKFQSSRKIMEGEPSILITRGKINFDALKKQQINLDELMEELRLSGHFDLEEIEYAILENNGQISFLTTNQAYSMIHRQQKSKEKELDLKRDKFNNMKNTLSPIEQIQHQLDLLKAEISDDYLYQNKPKPLLPIIYVVDGKVNINSVTSPNKNKVWIENELKKHNIDSIEKVLIAMTDTSGKFIYQLYDEHVEVKKK